MHLRLAIATLCLLAPALRAQCFEADFGSFLGRGDDGPLQPLRAIGFAFPFAGTTWSHVQISNNGMFYLTHGGSSGGTATGYSDSPATLAANLCGTPGQAPRIAPFWKDLNLLLANDAGVFVDDTRPDRCVITWRNAVEWGSTAMMTVQCQLGADGSVRFWYSDALHLGGGAVLIGISAGAGAVDPGPLDLGGPAMASGAVAYQTFTAANADFDLAGRTVSFVPNGSGGYAVSSMVCAPANHMSYGHGCGELARESFYVPLSAAAAASTLSGGGVTMRARPGGYSVETVQAAFLPPTAAANTLSLGDDGEITVPLAHPFAHPGGLASSLHVHANGIVSLSPLGALSPNAWSPNGDALLDASSTTWCLWHDFDPTAGGHVRTQWQGLVFCITWDAVWDFGGASAAHANTFQFQFDTATGDVHCVCPSLSALGVTDFLLGYSPGGSSLDPGPLDLGALPRVLKPDRRAMSLQVAPAPILGRTMVFVTENIPEESPWALQVVSFGAIDPGFDLGVYGAPGCLQSVDFVFAVYIPLLRPGADFYQAQVPNAPWLVGRVVASQSAALDAFTNALGVVTSNAVRSTLNTF